MYFAFYSIVGSDDNWTCEIEFANNSNISYLCNFKEVITFVQKWDEQWIVKLLVDL